MAAMARREMEQERAELAEARQARPARRLVLVAHPKAAAMVVLVEAVTEVPEVITVAAEEAVVGKQEMVVQVRRGACA